jgi:ribosome-associated toxin RatA of RatAB toxin-antitoxin module
VLALVLLLSSAALAEEDDVKVAQNPVPGSDVPVNIVEGMVDAPPAKIWAIVSKCADYAKNMPRVAKSAELSREGDEAGVWKVKCEVTAHLPFPLSDLTGITLATHTVRPDGGFVREWSLVSGDYELNNGSWTLDPRDEGKKTYVTYKLQVRPKIHLPMGLIAKAQKGALKEVITRMRENVKAR